MLNSNDPKTLIIFKASAFIDQIRIGCAKYTTQSFTDRQSTFLKMSTSCLDLIEFSKLNYAEKINPILELTNKILIEINILSQVDEITEKGKCCVCNGELTYHKSIVKELGDFHFCNNCPKNIYKYLETLDGLTGAWMI